MTIRLESLPGVVPWQPPGGDQLPSSFISDLLVAHDGTLWIGTLIGLASWRNNTFTRYREVAGADVISLLEDRQQTIRIGTSEASKKGRLCAIRGGKIECYGANIIMVRGSMVL